MCEQFARPAPVATPPCGPVSGRWCRGAAVFSGIPYGQSCAGQARFLPPRAAEPWKELRDASRNGPYAVQMGDGIFRSDLGPYFTGGHPEDFGLEGERQGEDCLVLNVVTPAVDAARRPVVVYIHGGGFATGSGGLVLGAGGMACSQDLVLVGVNHRLNVFGYLYLGGLDETYRSSGMVGILDLVLALEWVRDNIAAFGGDPDNVTVLGESGGGGKISTLLAMECAAGLFHKAVVESGSMPVATLSRETAAAATQKLLAALGLQNESPARQLAALQSLPAGELCAAAAGIPGLRLEPVADEVYLTHRPSRDYIGYPCSDHVPLLVGCSAEENAVFTDRRQLAEMTWENLCPWLEKALNGWMSSDPVDITHLPAIVVAFRKLDPQAAPAVVAMRIVSQASVLGNGSWHHAMAKAARPDAAPVYAYYITRQSPMPGAERPYAWHTADLPLQMGLVLHEESRAFAGVLAGMVGSFARTAAPQIDGCGWPPFTVEQQLTMVLDDVPYIDADPQGPARKALKAE